MVLVVAAIPTVAVVPGIVIDPKSSALGRDPEEELNIAMLRSGDVLILVLDLDPTFAVGLVPIAAPVFGFVDPAVGIVVGVGRTASVVVVVAVVVVAVAVVVVAVVVVVSIVGGGAGVEELGLSRSVSSVVAVGLGGLIVSSRE